MKKAANSRTHAQDAVREMARIFKRLEKPAAAIVSSRPLEYDERDRLIVNEQRDRLLRGLLATIPDTKYFLDTYFTPADGEDTKKSNARKRSVLRLLIQSLAYGSIDGVVEPMFDLAKAAFEAEAVAEAQTHIFNDDRLPDIMRSYLPPNIMVDLDPYGKIAEISDLYANENKDLKQKIERMKFIVSHYNDFVQTVKKDMKSSDQKTALLAVVTGIIMETGIRTGAGGSSAMKDSSGGLILDEHNEKIYMETFGALSLRLDHVLTHDEVVHLGFPGKAGTFNQAEITDSLLVEAMYALTESATISSRGLETPPFLFVLKDGSRISEKMLSAYFKKNLKGIVPTDFRKLRSSKALFDALRAKQRGLLEKIRGFVDDASDDLKKRASEEIAATINQAFLEAQSALSHEDVSTTVGAYINPTVILNYLERGGAGESFEEAVLTQPKRLTFDPELFIQQARNMRLARQLRIAVGLFGRRNATLLDVVDDLQTELGERTSSLLDVVEDLESELS